jgi:hypothetical protein
LLAKQNFLDLKNTAAKNVRIAKLLHLHVKVDFAPHVVRNKRIIGLLKLQMFCLKLVGNILPSQCQILYGSYFG